jgi:hypothetical protein
MRKKVEFFKKDRNRQKKGEKMGGFFSSRPTRALGSKGSLFEKRR